MAHPYSEHKECKTSKKRVGTVLRGGGYEHDDEDADKELFADLMRKHEGKDRG